MTQYVDEDFVNKQKNLRPNGFVVKPDQYKKYENIARELYQQTALDEEGHLRHFCASGLSSSIIS